LQESIITTKNVKEALSEVVKRSDLYDFELAQYSTYLFNSSTGAYNNDIADKHISEEVFLHPDMRIGQEYTIIFKEYTSGEEKPDKLLEAKLTASKDMCEVYADIKLNEEIPYTQEDIFSNIVAEINKKKALYGVLIGIFDECVFEELTQKVDELMKNMSTKMLVSKSPYRAMDTQKFEIQRVFLENKLNINSKFIQTFPGKILLKVTPHIQGHGGRNCFGKYIYFQDYEQGDIPKISHNSETVQMSEDSSGKLIYMAKVSGLVEFENFNIDVKDSVVLDKISQTKTGDIELDSVNVYVKAKDELDDSVENGTTVESEKLDVDTMVGANSRVKSNEVTIRASTHSTSNIEAEIANIKIHKGRLKAVTAEIGTLEHGFIEAKEVHIENVLGGVVRADTISIDNIQASFADIMAHKKISIGNVIGDGNIFRIKYGFNQDEIDVMEDLKKKLEYTGNDLTKLGSTIDKHKKFFIMHKMRIDEIIGLPKNKMTLAQQRMAEAAINTKNIITELELKKSKLQNQRDSLQKKLNQFANDIFLSEVRIKKCTQGNILEFTVFREKKDLVVRYVTTEHDNDTVFTIDEGLRIKKERM